MSSKAQEDGVHVGAVVASTYEIVSILGRGGMGTVWEAHHKRLPGKRVAIKVLHPSVAEDTDALARFRREAEIACRLGHPNIVEVHDFNSLADGTPYLVLELLEGQSLDERLKAGQLSVEVCEQILRQVASALQCAHEQGVIHRDLKPQNIFLLPSPTGVGPEIAKVLDFGISKIRGSQTVKTQESTLLGTPQYMAPEQATGQHDDVDARTDLFALAVMLYELLSGRAAFAGQNIPEVVYKVVHVDPQPIKNYLPELADEKAAALHKAMSKAQADRFGSVAEFVEAFTGIPLAATRIRNTPAPSDLAQASTIASAKLAVGSAATMDSKRMATPAGGSMLDLASAATIDSQKVAREQALAATIDSSKMERQSTLMAAQAAQPAMTQAGPQALTAAAPRTVPLRTLLIIVGLMAGIGAGVWILAGGSSADTGSAVAVKGLAGEDLNKAPVQLAASDASVAHAVQDAQSSGTKEVAEEATKETTKGTGGQTSTEPETDKSTGSSDEKRLESVTPKQRDPRVTSVAPPEESTGKSEEANLLLDQARAELAKGQYESAIAKAKLAYRTHQQLQSYEVMVMASCGLADLSNANGALRNIPLKNRRIRKRLQAYCEKRNIHLDMRINRRN